MKARDKLVALTSRLGNSTQSSLSEASEETVNSTSALITITPTITASGTKQIQTQNLEDEQTTAIEEVIMIIDTFEISTPSSSNLSSEAGSTIISIL